LSTGVKDAGAPADRALTVWAVAINLERSCAIGYKLS